MQHLWFQVITVIVLTLSDSGLVQGQACSSPNITEGDWEWGIKDTFIDASHSGTIVEYWMENTLSVTTEMSGNTSKYIDATLENNVLRIFTTSAFESYEDRETAIEMKMRIALVCTSLPTKYLEFTLEINSANNHAPVFSESVYEIHIKLPLHKGFDLTFYKAVVARDIDLVNNRVFFHTPASNFVDVGTSAEIGDDKKTFYATLVLNQQLLTLTEEFSFTIIATDSGLGEPRTSTAQILIVPDKEITYIPPPRFQKAIYRGNISDTGIFSYEKPTIEKDSYSNDLSFTISGEDGDLFSVESFSENSVDVALKSPINEANLIGKTFLTATIVANHPEVFSGSTVLLIDLPTVTLVTTPKPTFEKSLTRGSINSELQLLVETIVLMESSYTSDTLFSMTGDDSATFLLTNEENVITITLKDPLSDDELVSRDFYSFIVVATHPTRGVGETAVLISLPQKQCEECLECPETTICPVCPTPAPPTVDMSPTFQNQFYSFTIKASEFGKVGDVLATSPSADAVIGYSITSENAYLMARLTIDSNTGEIFAQEELNSGYYEATVIAETTVDGEDLQTTSLIKLTVTPVITCPDGNVTVEKSLAIQYLKENEIHRSIFSTKINDCNYIIRSVQPNDKEYVSINPTTNMLESIMFDREDSIFMEYEVPQIQIKLKLNCDDNPTPASQFELHQPTPVTKQLPRSIDPSISDGRWYTLTNDIDFTSDLTVINIIIQDENDNYPIFDSSTPSLIGYPEPEIANHIIPSQLAVIHATDIDAGMNAKIKYTLAENNYFQINPHNGVITPLSDGWANVASVQLIVYATDNFGAENGLTSAHILRVKRLEEKHLTVVTLRDNNLNSSADDVIEQLNAESTIKMMVLHSAIVPYLPISSRQLQDGPLSALKMIIYAFGDDGEPLGTLQVQRQLEPFISLRQLTFTSYEDFLPSDEVLQQNIVWIIVVSVMGAIILLSVIAIFSMWWFKIRPYEYKTMVDEVAVSQENLQDDFPDFKVESSPPMARLDVERTEKRESVNIAGSTEMESTDEPSKRAILLLNLLDGEPQENSLIDENERRERKKSQGVTFNELVERIDIETDPVGDSDIELRR